MHINYMHTQLTVVNEKCHTAWEQLPMINGALQYALSIMHVLYMWVSTLQHSACSPEVSVHQKLQLLLLDKLQYNKACNLYNHNVR